MAHANWIAALALAAAAAPLAAAPGVQAPAGTADTRYCMKVEAVTGTRLERTKCWTRAQWADQGVDVDRDWPKEGVRTIG
jgi:hypothetical protein